MPSVLPDPMSETTRSGSLDASIAGSGDISYAGSPKKVNSNVAGSGEVRQVSTGGRL